ncbi:MAG: hypothetical protein Q9217_001601 [Psora testacea]
MKGVSVEKPGAAWKVVDNLDTPEPSDDQILVKAVATAINPVDTYMQSIGLLVTAWPIVLGCDASGIVVKVGKAAGALFKVGDRVCGCTRLGVPGYSAFQEYFLMDARLTLSIPKDLSFQQGATLGVGTYTACLGLHQGLKLNLSDASLPTPAKEDWVVILGGAGSVGQYSVQITKAMGYKVVTTCSQKTASLVQGLGADAVIDYSKTEEDQLRDLKSITDGNFIGVFDTVAKSEQWARKALKDVSTMKQKYFATTDDWSPMEKYEDMETCRVELGLIGRSEDELKVVPTLNEDVASYVPFLTQLLENGKLRPNEYRVVGTGFEGIAGAVEAQQKGTSGGVKVVVELQDA